MGGKNNCGTSKSAEIYLSTHEILCFSWCLEQNGRKPDKSDLLSWETWSDDIQLIMLHVGDQMKHELRWINVWSSLDLNICRIWDDVITQNASEIQDFNVEMVHITSCTFILCTHDDKCVKCQNMTCSFERSLKDQFKSQGCNLGYLCEFRLNLTLSLAVNYKSGLWRRTWRISLPLLLWFAPTLFKIRLLKVQQLLDIPLFR